MQAFVEPVLALHASREGHYYAVLVARETARSAAHEGSGVLAGMFGPLAHRFIDALHRLRPHWPRAGVEAVLPAKPRKHQETRP